MYILGVNSLSDTQFSNIFFSFIDCSFKKRFYLFIFREGEGREKEKMRNIDVRERNIDWLASCACPTGYRAYNPGVWPDRTRTSNRDLSICRMMPKQLPFFFFFFRRFKRKREGERERERHQCEISCLVYALTRD